MFFSVRELESRKIPFDAEIPAGEIDYLDANLKQVGSLKTSGVAELVSHTLGDIRLHGNVQVTLEAPCDRCLEPAAIPIQSAFDLRYLPPDSEAAGDEKEIEDDQSDVAFYEGDGVKLEDVIREFVLLALPMQVLCRRDCQGICAECGQNRNVAACKCESKPADDRWAALGNL